jgi:hypothetical protein
VSRELDAEVGQDGERLTEGEAGLHGVAHAVDRDGLDECTDMDRICGIGEVDTSLRRLLWQDELRIDRGDVRGTVEPVAVLVDDLFPFTPVADVIGRGDGVAQFGCRLVCRLSFYKAASTADALLQLIFLKVVDGAMHHP